MLIPTLFTLAVISTIMLFALAYGVRYDIEKQDPTFASVLYRSGAAMFLARGFPLRGTVLLFHKHSSVKRSTLMPLQIVYCVNTILSLALIVAILRG